MKATHPPAPLVLIPGAPAARSLTRHAVVVCRIPAGGPYQVLVDQQEHDFSIDILDRDAIVARTVDGFDYGVERATIGGTAGTTVRIRRSDDADAEARFTVILTEVQQDRVERSIDAETSSTAARVLRRRGDSQSLKQAAEVWRRAADAWRLLNDDSGALRSEIALANTFHALNEYSQARELYADAIALSGRLGDQRSTVECLNNRGTGFWQQGDFARAAADWKAAMTLWDKLPVSAGRLGTLINLGLLSWQVGEYQGALDDFLKAEKAAVTLGDRRSRPFVINNLALTYGALGDDRRSAALFERAASMFDRIGDHGGAGRAFAYSARVWLRMGARERAASNLARGAPLIERTGDRRGLAEAWNLMGEADTQSGRFAAAMRRQLNARDLFHIVGDRRGEANAIANLGLTSLAAGDNQSAIEWLEQALSLHRTLGTPASEASVMYHLAVAQRKSGNLDEALRTAAGAVDLAERLRGSVAVEKLRISFLASTHDYYWENLDLLMQCAERRHSAALEQAGWQVAERGRARALLDALAASRMRAGGSAIDPRERDLTAQVNAKTVLLARAPSANEELRRSLQQSMDELRQAQSLADGDQRQLADAVSRGALDLASVQREALDSGDALIEYALGTETSYAWLIQPDGIAAYRMPPRETLERLARRMALLMNGRRTDRAAEADADFRADAEALANYAIVPLLPRLHATRLLIVPDGALSATPFAALPLPGGGYLLDRFEVVTAPSAAALLALRRTHGDRLEKTPRLAVMADPVFDVSDSRVRLAVAASSASTAAFDRLLFSRREALSIASIMPPGTSKVLLGFEAVKSSFTDGTLTGYNILHIATHGILDFDRPELSAMLFSQVRRDGSARDGKLSLDEIYRLRLDADLVSLSACQTAFGKEVTGEGAMSLSYGFLHAGARRVIASLWPVDDEATAELLSGFYAQWLHSPGESPSAVLRRSQLALRQTPRWRAPYYWASLVLQGEQ